MSRNTSTQTERAPALAGRSSTCCWPGSFDAVLGQRCGRPAAWRPCSPTPESEARAWFARQDVTPIYDMVVVSEKLARAKPGRRARSVSPAEGRQGHRSGRPARR